MKITKEWLIEKNACSEGVKWFQKQKKREASSVCRELLAENHFDWANWFLSKAMDKENCVRYAIFAVEQVIEIYEQKYSQNDRPRKAMQAAKDYLDGKITAADAARAAYAAADAADDADAAYAEIKTTIIEYGLKLLKKQEVSHEN